jgi:tellurite resistance protein TerC
LTSGWSSWVAVAGILGAAVAVDLFVFHRQAHVVSTKKAARASAAWIALGVGFGVVIWITGGAQDAGQYFAGYLVEKALSVDNLFVIVVLMGAFAVPIGLQHRVLFYGVVGALVLRAGFIAAGTSMLHRFDWVMYLFGALLLVLSVRMLRADQREPAPGENRTVRLLRRVLPVTAHYEGSRLLVRRLDRTGRTTTLVTPLLLVLGAIETTDLIFAADSIPVVLAITDNQFLVFASNAFAILGLRSLYFVLATATDRLVHLQKGLAVILSLAGLKMLLGRVVHVPVWASLLAIVVILTVSVLVSLKSGVPADAATSPTRALRSAREAADP